MRENLIDIIIHEKDDMELEDYSYLVQCTEDQEKALDEFFNGKVNYDLRHPYYVERGSLTEDQILAVNKFSNNSYKKRISRCELILSAEEIRALDPASLHHTSKDHVNNGTLLRGIEFIQNEKRS